MKQRKTLFLLLVFMLASLFTLPGTTRHVAAETPIDTMQVVLAAPTTGGLAKNAGLSVDPVHQPVFSIKDDGVWSFVNDESEVQYLNADDKFVRGKEYTYTVTTEAKEGYAFADSVELNVTNPPSILSELRLFKVEPEEGEPYYQLQCKVQLEDAITEVELVSFEKPELGAYPSLVYQISDEAPYVSTDGYSGTVSNLSGLWLENGTAMSLTNKFAAGKSYKFQMKLEAKDQFYFASEPVVKFPDGTTHKGSYDSGKLTLDFGTFYNEVTSVRVGDVTAPADGETPDASYTIPANNDYAYKDSGEGQWKWYEGEESGEVAADETFAYGKGYTFSMTLHVKDTAANFPEDLDVEIYPSALAAKVKSTDVEVDRENQTATITLDFGTLSKTPVRPAGPTTFVATSLADGSIRLSWDPVENTDYYAIYYLGTDGATNTYKTITPNTVWVDLNASVGDYHFYRVFAVRVTEDGQQIFSLAPSPLYAFAKSVKTDRPAGVTGFNARPLEGGGVRLGWDASPRADYYAIYYLGTDGKTNTYKTITPNTVWVDLNASAGDFHFYRVFAVELTPENEQIFSLGPTPNYVWAKAK